MWLAFFVLLTLALLYAFILRPLLKEAPILSEAFKAEASLLDIVRVKVAGFKTKLTARLLMIAGGLVGLYDQILPYFSTQDWTPITHRMPDWSVPLGMASVGFIFSWLRHVTENPPQIVTQKMDDGTTQVVAINKPAA